MLFRRYAICVGNIFHIVIVKNFKYMTMGVFTFSKTTIKMKTLLGKWGDFRIELILIRGKWFEFKRNIETNKLKMKRTATEWSLQYIVNNYKGQEFSLIIKYAKIAITVPVTNAWPERGASAVKSIKSQLRSNMKMDLLTLF